MKIDIKSIKIKDEWDFQKGKLLLELNGIGGIDLNLHQREYLKKNITLFLWNEIKKYFPQVEYYCDNKTGHLNDCDKNNYNTPIICIYGHFYMQYIKEYSNNAWMWESIDLEPYRFFFNEYGYLKDLFIKIENKMKEYKPYNRRQKPKYKLSDYISKEPLKPTKTYKNYQIDQILKSFNTKELI